MRVVMQRALRALAYLKKNQFFYNLNAPVQRRRVSAVRCNRLLAGAAS